MRGAVGIRPESRLVTFVEPRLEPGPSDPDGVSEKKEETAQGHAGEDLSVGGGAGASRRR